MKRYPAAAIANFFIQKGISENNDLTLMKLNKLIYIAHGTNLAANDSPLIDELVQAWKFGPVVSSIYHKLKYFGMFKITDEIPEIDLDDHGRIVENNYKIDNKNILRLLTKTWDNYKKYSGFQLSNWTHLPESPWYKVWFEDGGKNQREKPIPNELIKNYFLTLG